MVLTPSHSHPTVASWPLGSGLLQLSSSNTPSLFLAPSGHSFIWDTKYCSFLLSSLSQHSSDITEFTLFQGVWWQEGALLSVQACLQHALGNLALPSSAVGGEGKQAPLGIIMVPLESEDWPTSFQKANESFVECSVQELAKCIFQLLSSQRYSLWAWGSFLYSICLKSSPWATP